MSKANRTRLIGLIIGSALALLASKVFAGEPQTLITCGQKIRGECKPVLHAWVVVKVGYKPEKAHWARVTDGPCWLGFVLMDHDGSVTCAKLDLYNHLPTKTKQLEVDP